MVQETSTAYHTYAGTLVIISSCILIAWTSFSVLSSSQYLLRSPVLFASQVLYTAMSLAVDTIGLVSGIMSILRRYFVFAIVGVSFILLFSVFTLQGAITVLLFNLAGAESDYPDILFISLSIAAVCLSLLAVVYIAKARGEFTDQPVRISQ